MKKRIIWEILFICLLGVAGWYLFGLMKKAESNNPVQNRIERNNSLGFSAGAGIDIMGNEIEPISLNSLDEVEVLAAAFLLRFDSLNADLKFWNEVGSQLPDIDTVRLTAYCEDTRCIETIRKNPDMAARITILEYGVVVDMQAVINADANGDFWLRRNGTLKKIKWRAENLTPYDIVDSVKESGVRENERKDN